MVPWPVEPAFKSNVTPMKKDTSPQPARRPLGGIIFLILAVAACVCAAAFILNRQPASSSASPPGVVEPDSEPTAAKSSGHETAVVNPRHAPLVGRWMREDGGYVVEIRSVGEDGRLDAGYFNPRPIHVSKAAVAEEGGSVKVGIELDDVGYPGCLYTLVFNRELDQLQGTYFQAAQGQTYPVAFVRMPAE